MQMPPVHELFSVAWPRIVDGDGASLFSPSENSSQKQNMYPSSLSTLTKAAEHLGREVRITAPWDEAGKWNEQQQKPLKSPRVGSRRVKVFFIQPQQTIRCADEESSRGSSFGATIDSAAVCCCFFRTFYPQSAITFAHTIDRSLCASFGSINFDTKRVKITIIWQLMMLPAVRTGGIDDSSEVE